MKLLIISGRSGSGKTTALQALEDQGFYCVDNLPLGLLPTLASQLQEESHHVDQIAVGIDARNLPHQLPRFGALLERVRDLGLRCEVIFLDADPDTLLKRFSATRRRHPLSDGEMGLAEAIHYEGELLNSIRSHADLNIDTSQLDPHTLRNLIRERTASNDGQLSLLIQSFGFKNGVPGDADMVYDVRVLPNPHWDPALRPYTGRDTPVMDFLAAQPEVSEMLGEIGGFLERWLPRYQENDRNYLTVAIGCTGGRHRSVYLSERIAEQLRNAGIEARVRHRELG